MEIFVQTNNGVVIQTKKNQGKTPSPQLPTVFFTVS
jgi:hypothetical protein